MSETNTTELTTSRELVESYIFASGNRDLSIYSERLLMRIVEVAQQQLLGARFVDGTDIGQVSIGTLGDAKIEIPIRSILGSGIDSNYTHARKAITELMLSPQIYERPKMNGGKPVFDTDGRQEFEMIGFQILNNVELNVKPGYAVLEVNKNTWTAILDFSKGFRRYDISAALKLRKPASLRLFRLLSNQTVPITYTIDKLREIFGLEGRYKDSSDFIRHNIEPAKEELDKCAPWSFDYVRNYSESAEVNRRGVKKSITSLTFTPKRKIEKFSTAAILKVTDSPRSVLGLESMTMLIRELGFTKTGLANNLLLFKTAKDEGVDIFGFLENIKPKALRANSPQGYVIKALTNHLKETFNIEMKDLSDI